jgi:diadenosine tetraphosphatase ApaH/serine/threonine PP2A family protein phosphatase
VKVAVLSDIHSNLEALDACLAVATARGVGAFACLGDLVNYGADPAATLDRIMRLPGLIAVLGNHDEAMFLPPRWPVGSEVEHAAAWTRQRLQPEHVNFLRDLAYVQHAHGAAFAHAAFDAPSKWEYVVTSRQAQRSFKVMRASLLFFGHVHVPCIFTERADGGLEELDPEAGHTYPLAGDRRYLVNVGSVGQPRDGNNAACFVIYDSAARSVTFERVGYAHAAAAEKIRAAGLHPFYAERLASGQ